MSPITLTTDHGLVVISAAAIALQCIITGFIPDRRRNRFFNQAFLEKHFADQHLQETGAPIVKGGYPDMGNGRYAEKLSYREWYEFNLSQRVHYNFIEHIASVLILLILGGIALPTAAGWLGWAYFIGRVFYTAGYLMKGPKGRLVGALIVDLSFIGLVGVAFASGGMIYNM